MNHPASTRTLELAFTQDGAHGAVAMLARFYREGWETLTPTRWCPECCGHYVTTLFLPDPKSPDTGTTSDPT